MKYLIGIIAILSVLLAITSQKACTTTNSRQADTSIVVNVNYDSTLKVIPTTPATPYHPKLISTTFTKVDTFYKNVDSAAIIQQWLFSTNYFEQLYRDSSIDIFIADSIKKNTITSRTIAYKIIRPCFDTTKTIVIEQRQKLQWWIGSDFGFGTSTGISPKLMIIHNKNRAYSIQSNILQPQPNATIGVAFKIK